MTPPDRAHRWAAVVLGVYTVLVAVIGLVPRPIDDGLTPWTRGVLAAMHQRGFPGWLDYNRVELAAHIWLFVPFGILAAVALGRQIAWLAVLAGLVMSALVEFGPSLLGSEHPPSMRDLLLNAVGAIAGVAIGYWAATPRRHPMVE